MTGIIKTAATAAMCVAWSAIAGVPCPPAGSGAQGVADWAAENCGPTDCTNPATTCNGQFTIELKGTSTAGSYITFEYEVCQIAGQNGLSHWGIGLGQIDCLGTADDGRAFSLDDLVVGASLNGNPLTPGAGGFVVGLDPTTQLYGIKFDTGVPAGSCNTYTVTFDTSKLAEGYTLGIGCTVGATKAGNQDIRPANNPNNQAPSPGYACAEGPVCVFAPPPECWKDETAWSAGPRYTPKGNWATYTQYSANKMVTLFAGQVHVAGTVHFSPVDGDGNVTITITLNPGFRFDPDTDESVKVQGYANPPSGNPAPGQFANKADAETSPFSIVVPAANYYGVHVDVERKVDCPS